MSENIKPPRGERPSVIPQTHLKNVSVKDGYVLCTSDHHYPIHCKPAEKLITKLSTDLKPHTWVFNGDVIDCWWISRHENEADRLFDDSSGNRIVDEINAARPLLLHASNLCKNVYLGEGNHERRLQALINANPGLHGLPGLTWKSIWGLPNNVEHLGYGYKLRMGPVTFIHGDSIGGRGSWGPTHLADWVLNKWGCRTSHIFGHFHRMETKHRTIWEDVEPTDVVAIAQGHLSDVSKQKYVQDPSWQKGFVILEFFSVGGKMKFTPHPIQIVQNRFSFCGKTYRL